MRTSSAVIFYSLSLFSLAACGGSAPSKTQATTSMTTPSTSAATATEVAIAPAALARAKEIVDAPDRAAEDKTLDAGRHPAETLAFFGIAPGMHVAEIVAGFGYTTELLARAVGPTGVVYGQNNKFVLERFAEKSWSARLAKPINKNVVRVDRELDDPLPAEAKNLDAVIDVLFYHDTVWMKTDRAKMNERIFAALKSGGVYGIIDHSGRPGTGTSENETLHRIEEKVVREEVLKAGFMLAAEASFLKNASDTRDWNASPRAAADKRGTSDRFALKFVKP